MKTLIDIIKIDTGDIIYVIEQLQNLVLMHGSANITVTAVSYDGESSIIAEVYKND